MYTLYLIIVFIVFVINFTNAAKRTTKITAWFESLLIALFWPIGIIIFIGIAIYGMFQSKE